MTGKGHTLATSAAGQVAFFEYTYDTAPDFSTIRVGVTLSLAEKPAADGKPESQVYGRKLIYAQTVTSVVQLQDPTGAGENAARWAANDGSLARRALTAAFGEVSVLIPRALGLTEDDLKTLGASDRKSLAHYSGKIVEEGPDGVLLFNGGLIHVQTLHE